jgi:glutathione S-transferase
VVQGTTEIAMSWAELERLDTMTVDRVYGPTNAQATVRKFNGASDDDIRVTLYRDHHAWCPYCQKVWLWLEEKQISYRIQKVTMFCYGEKEAWYKKKVPSGMLPAVELDGRLITESDDILLALEAAFGPLTQSMTDKTVVPLRQLERFLFRAWCRWLCMPMRSQRQEQESRRQFIEVASEVERAIAASPGDYFLDAFGIVDVVFTPYVERMNASLFYYKGYSLRDEHPKLAAWFDAMETRPTYRGTQSDFHTHAHDLPPQMGGCWSNQSAAAIANQTQVDQGSWFGLPDVAYPEPETARQEALHRVLKHRQNILRVNPVDEPTIDIALRCALTQMMGEAIGTPPAGSDVGLRYLRDRISVPRDMSIYAAKHLRTALEATAALVGDRPGPEIPIRHRRDQDPQNFRSPDA